MNKTTYTADGVSAEFNFEQKWFRPDDIHATINGMPTDCAVVPMTTEPEYETPEMKAANDLGIAAHFGGRVIFTTPPPAGATISITRRISIDERLISVARTAAVRPNDFNSFTDWITEYLKDLATDLTGLENIGALPEITAGVEAARALISDASGFAAASDLSAAMASIDNLAAAVQSLSEQLENEPGRIISQSAPGANPWHIKFKNGWVVQGGRTGFVASNASHTVSFPIQMMDTNYSGLWIYEATNCGNVPRITGRTATSMTLAVDAFNTTAVPSGTRAWEVKGWSA